MLSSPELKSFAMSPSFLVVVVAAVAVVYYFAVKPSPKTASLGQSTNTMDD